MTEEHLVVDLSSVMSKIQSACANIRAELLHIHPMWSPQVSSMAGQTMVISASKELSERATQLVEIFKRQRVVLAYLTVEEHDRIMAIIQVTSHAAILAVGLAYKESGFSVAQLTQVESPVYRMMSAMVGRMVSHQSELYADIAILNQFGSEAVSNLRGAVERIEEAILAQDSLGYQALVDLVRQHRISEISTAVDDSSTMIEALALKRHKVAD
jgi:prephenate dehydrogenase